MRPTAPHQSVPVPPPPSRLRAVALALLCATAAATTAALHGAQARSGPLPALARTYAHATVELELTTDPRPTRPHVSGATRAPAGIVAEAEALRVTPSGAPPKSPTATRTPVLLIVQHRPSPGEDTSHSPQRATAWQQAWLQLLPSTRVRVQARLAPATRAGPGGDRIAAVLRVVGAEAPAPAITRTPTTLQRAAGALRAGLRRATDGLPADARALLPGLVIGDTTRIPAELDEAFHATDLTHLLAVSGANFTILLAVLIGPPHLATRPERRGLAPRVGISLRGTALLGGALTLGFVVVCRPEPSVLRAAACGLITLVAIGTGRRRSLLPALAAAVLLLVLYDPWLARDFGFLLSVLATGALLTIAPRWSSALRRRGLPPRLAEVLAAAAAAQAACAPVVAVLAARVGLVAVPCNLLAELAVAPATVLGFAALAAAPLSLPLAKAAAWPAALPAEWIAGVARTGAALPGAEVRWPGGWAGGLLLAALTALVLGAGPRLLRSRAARRSPLGVGADVPGAGPDAPGAGPPPPLSRRPTPWLAGGVVLLLLLAVVRPPPLTRVLTGWPPPGWRLVACDVGQGDALVLATRRPGTAVVIDTGPEPRLVDRCLRRLGVDRIPLLILTHFHADHVDGLPGALRGRAIGAIQTTTYAEPPGQAAFVRRTAASARIPVITAAAGERRRLGPDLRWQVLWPPAQAPAGDAGEPHFEDVNDASVTLLVRTAGLTLFLPGDLEPPAQQQLLTAHPDLPAVDVLKVAHHGSSYQDPSLQQRLHPRLALLSVGRRNPYGHPSPRTLAALAGQGASVLRTDLDGAVAVVAGRRPGADKEADRPRLLVKTSLER